MGFFLYGISSHFVGTACIFKLKDKKISIKEEEKEAKTKTSPHKTHLDVLVVLLGI